MSTVHALLEAYASKTLTPADVYKEAVCRAREAHQGKTGEGDGNNEWTYVVSPAEVEARLADLSRIHPNPKNAPLYGIPFAVKDNINVAGIPTTAGFKMSHAVPEISAICVERIRNAGALFVGKTNMDQFASAFTGTRSPFGAVPSTYSAEHISGGSSSGSAAVVSRCVVPFSLGTDTLGCSGVAAAFNGVVTLKPSVGRVSTTGVVTACRSLDCVTVIALTASDAARVLAVMESEPATAGALMGDVRFSRPLPGPSRFPTALRVGIPKHINSRMSSEYRVEFARAVSSIS